MDFKVDKLGPSKPGLSRLNAAFPDFAKNRTTQALASSVGDTARISSEPVKVSNSLLANNAQDFTDVAANAANAISDARSRQLELAKQAEAISDPEKQASLGTEISAIESEISRISQAATFNGQNALQGGGVTIIETNKLYTAVNTADLSVLAQNPNISVSNQTNAKNAVTTLKQVLLSAQKATDGTEVALSKAEDTVSETIEEVDLDSQQSKGLQSIEEAENLAQAVAQEIRARFRPENTENDVVINNLDQDRVSSLLSED